MGSGGCKNKCVNGWFMSDRHPVPGVFKRSVQARRSAKSDSLNFVNCPERPGPRAGNFVAGVRCA